MKPLSERTELDDMLQKLQPKVRGEMVQLRQDLTTQFHQGREEDYSLAHLVTDLLPKLEAARKQYLAGDGSNPQYHSLIEAYAQRKGRQFMQDFPMQENMSYWRAASALLTADFGDSYARLASRKNQRESSKWYQYLYGNKYALAVASALPGIFTLRYPISTPIVMGAGAALGYKVLHPFIQRRVDEDVHRLADFTIHQQKRIDVQTKHGRKDPSQFTLRAVINDLLPLLETARLAGKGSAEFTSRVERYMTELQEDYGSVSYGHVPVDRVTAGSVKQGDDRVFSEMQAIVKEEFLPRFIAYAKSQNKIEERGLWYRIISNKWASATASTMVFAPLYFMASRVLPFGIVDDVLMAGLFAAGGYHAPKIINPGYEDIQTLYKEICSRDKKECVKLDR